MDDFSASKVNSSPAMQGVYRSYLPNTRPDSDITHAILALTAATYAQAKLPDSGQEYTVTACTDTLVTALKKEGRLKEFGEKEVFKKIKKVIDAAVAPHVGVSVAG